MGGDRKFLLISVVSILVKVWWDILIICLVECFFGYDLVSNKGYGMVKYC